MCGRHKKVLIGVALALSIGLGGLRAEETRSKPENPDVVFINHCLERFDGLVVQREAFCGQVKDGILAFRMGKGGEVRTLSTEDIALIRRQEKGQLEILLRTGERLQGRWETEAIRLRLPIVAEAVLSVPTHQLELLVFQGQLFQLPMLSNMEEFFAVADYIRDTFLWIRLRKDTIVLGNGSVLTGRVMKTQFTLKTAAGTRTFRKSEIDTIFWGPDGQVTVIPRCLACEHFTGMLKEEAVNVQLRGQLTIILSMKDDDVRQLVFANPRRRYSGAGGIQKFSEGEFVEL